MTPGRPADRKRARTETMRAAVRYRAGQVNERTNVSSHAHVRAEARPDLEEAELLNRLSAGSERVVQLRVVPAKMCNQASTPHAVLQ
jgi:hypothetical protein